MTINERVKYLRKEVIKLTKQNFSKVLNIFRSNMGNIETGQISLTERIILDICEKYNVNETWLRTGEGEIFAPMSRSETIAQFAGELMRDEDESFRRQLIEALAQLDEKEWEVLEGIAKRLTKKD